MISARSSTGLGRRVTQSLGARALSTRRPFLAASSHAIRGLSSNSAISTVVQAARRSRARAVSSPWVSPRAFTTGASLATPLEPEVLKTARPADLTDAQYHELADDYLETLLTKFEAMQDERDSVDVEYSAGVMNVKIHNIGTYVVNKQPPNKQIWLSSPTSGPKRYDYVVISEGQNQKQDTATGVWVYLRDGTTLNEILWRETGVNMDTPTDS